MFRDFISSAWTLKVLFMFVFLCLPASNYGKLKQLVIKLLKVLNFRLKDKSCLRILAQEQLQSLGEINGKSFFYENTDRVRQTILKDTLI